ncbi:MAG: hypothetical protein KAI79_19095, partial [Bacteroidales bacterium]|nr:hypothetical protein [Bacteroidales bacterium]
MKTFYFILILLFCSSNFSFGSGLKDINLSFRRISPEGGFTYGAINSIEEDADGFIWFGTVHGLYRYNSVNTHKFVHKPLDSNTIPGNAIRAIYSDIEGTLWIGTNQGVCIYDKEKDIFLVQNLQDIKSDQYLNNSIRDIFQGNKRDVIFLSSNMLGKIDLETNQFEKIFENSSLNENFTSAIFDSTGKIWIGGTNGTVWYYDISKQKIHKFCHQRSELIKKIFVEETGIWVGYDGAGLDHIGLNGNLISHYGGNIDDANKIHHNRIRDIYKDDMGRIWVTTYKGISIISEKEIYNVTPQEIGGLPYNSVYKIFKDSKNGIWIGTWAGGLAYQSSFDNRFIHSRKDVSEYEADDEFVSSFAEKPDGTILIGTEFGNLNKLDRVTNRMVNIPFQTENNHKIENIKALVFDEQSETLWVGTFLDGLWYQKKNDKTLRPLNIFNQNRIRIYALAMMDSLLLIGTYGEGFYTYNTKTRDYEQYTPDNNTNSISNNRIRSIIVDKKNNVWIGTRNGLNIFDPKTKTFRRFMFNPNIENGISSREIFALKQDNQGIIWIGTGGGGLNKYNPETNSFENFKIRDGVSGNDVYGIEEDKNGLLWVSTDNGITNIDPKQNTYRNYFRDNELEGSQFNPGAVFQSSNGEILFGDTQGFTFFIPEEMKTNPFPPKVILTSLSINNIPIDYHSVNSPLKRTLQSEMEIKLKYNQNSLRFNFVANNFLHPNKNSFKYRLVNYDNDWIDAGTQNFAVYTKIPHGDYTLEVIACNNDNLWNDTPVQLKIEISPPFWLAWYAYVIYLIIMGLIVYFIHNWMKERQQIKKELLLEKYAHESEVHIHELKQKFFTNISHEFRTPLTLITSPINQLLENFKLEPDAKEHLLTMQRNSRRLLRLINQLIDVRKIDLGKAAFQPQKADLITVCKEVVTCFEMEAKDKCINLSFTVEEENLQMFIDSEKVDKIFFNILSNAMKYTPENGSIGIRIYTTHSNKLPSNEILIGDAIEGNIVCIEFSDNGPGIGSDKIKSIFHRFEQGVNHQTTGTGIGLHMAYEYTRLHKGNIRVMSKVESGSIFTVCFPITEKNDYSKEIKNDYISETKAIQTESYEKEDIA